MGLEKLLNTKEAARVLGYSYKTLEAWRAGGVGPEYIRLPNGHIRYSHDDLIAWVKGDVRNNANVYA